MSEQVNKEVVNKPAAKKPAPRKRTKPVAKTTAPKPALEQTPEQVVENSMKAALMERGRILGINIHVNTSTENMMVMVNQALLYKNHAAPDATIPFTVSTDVAVARKEAERLIRVRVNNLDPTKSKIDSQPFGFSNSVIGTIQKVVPFDEEIGFHIPHVLLDVIRGTKYRVTRYRKDDKGNDIPYSVELPSFSVEVLPDLTGDEIEAIKQRQLSQQTIEK